MDQLVRYRKYVEIYVVALNGYLIDDYFFAELIVKLVY